MDAKIVWLMTFNLDHSEISGRRRGYVESFRRWLRVFQSASIPVAISIQGRDLEVLGMKKEELTGLDVLSAPYSHALEPLMVGRGNLHSHYEWLVGYGMWGNVPGRFLPEFAPSARQPSYPHGSFIPCLAGRASSFYSQPNTLGYMERREELEAAEAVCFRGQTWLPMHGAEPIAAAYQYFQRFPKTVEAQDGMVVAIEKHLGEHVGETRVIPMDFEACLVGSHHGIGAWEMFFDLLECRGLTPCFTPFRQSVGHWGKVAIHLGEKPVFIDRDLSKWRCRDLQRVAEDEVVAVPRLERSLQHRVFSLATTSDRWSALSGWMGKGVRLTADRGDLTIRPNLDMAQIGAAANQAIGSVFPAIAFGEQIAERYRQGALSDDGYWYASRARPFGFGRLITLFRDQETARCRLF